jgi:hypothetical protein
MTDCRRKYRNQFVRVTYLLMAISLVLIVSCATVSEKRYVENNTFLSNYPKMAIKVSPELKYVGEYHGDIFKKATFDMDMIRHKQERTLYIFCEKGGDGSVKRGVTIFTIKVPEGVRWLSEPFTSEKSKRGKMDTGKTEFGGMNWRYAMWTTNNFFGTAKDFVHDAGYSTTNQHLVFAIGKIITHEEDTIMLLYYIEDLRGSGFPNTMFEDKKRFLDEFFQRGLSAVQFLKNETTPEKALSAPTPLKRTSDKQMAYVPEKLKDGKIRKIKLRSTPMRVWESDIEKMIGKYNFFIKYKNELGYFQNDFVDNGDGTITDRATGLMWEKRGSSSVLQYWEAKRLVSRLNAEKFLGHDDWRIPTFEELCSLLESKRNENRQYIDALFNSKQTTCWTADYTFLGYYTKSPEYYIVDFSSGRVSTGGTYYVHQIDLYFLRAVRTTN